MDQNPLAWPMGQRKARHGQRLRWAGTKEGRRDDTGGKGDAFGDDLRSSGLGAGLSLSRRR